jgi:protein-S-isoprenylcysteine O-methyltransferase Ste14
VNETTDDHPGVVIFPPLLFVICVACGTLAYLVFPFRLALPQWVRFLGVALVPAAITFALWGQRIMKAAGTNVRPDQPATAIVSNGPFAFTRNPLYLSLLAIFAGIGIAAASLTFLAVIVPLALVLHFGVVLPEERYLDAKFGDTYRAYRARVRRWI